ncbi:MAG: protein-disulfide reductase DsbD domain-containing protein [Bryobacteraceae bacterium]
MPLSRGQSSAGALTLGEVQTLAVARGETARATLTLYVRTGFHVNSNKPNDDYLIPLRLTWDKGPVEAGAVEYPEPQLEKSGFSDKPLSVYSGTFRVITPFHASADAAPGPSAITGKLRYQACNDRECLQPRTMEVRVPLDIR